MKKDLQKQLFQSKCILCSNDFLSSTENKKYCSAVCRKRFYSIKESSRRTAEKEHIKCLWCNMDVVRIFGMHIRNYHPGKTTLDYTKEFPNSPIQTKADFINLTKNSGKFMQDPDRKKIYSERILGENNPNHRSKKYDEHQKKRLNTPFIKKNNRDVKYRGSYIANEFFESIYDKVKQDFKNIMFLKPELRLYSNETKYYYDFTICDINKIIEFNGDYWHCNPNKYTFDYIHKKSNKTASEIWDKDKNKIDCAIKNGYSLITIWEGEYRADKEKTIKKCLNFIYEN